VTSDRRSGRGANYIIGKDNIGNLRRIQSVVRGDGITALPIDGTVTVQSTFGADPLCDSHFKIVNTGATNDTLRIDIAATTADPTSPDRDVPAYTKTFTVQAGEVGDEIAFADRIVSELNLDSTFKDTCLLKAIRVVDRAIVHISSTAFSLSGEFYERPNAGDFAVTVTGSTSVIVVYDNMISRSKPVVLDRDPNNPHRSGVFGISGSVTVTSKDLEDLFIEEATHTTYGNDMLQNGSLGSPIDFMVDPSSTTDIFIETLIFDGQGNGIKFGQFLSKNSSLTNGVEVEIKSNNVITTFPLLYSTEDFKNKWAALSGDGANFRIDVQAGKDEMLAILSFPNPFILKIQGTFGVGNDDYIRVRIQDDTSSQITRFNFRAKGFEKEP
jgi:hypothetical protein